MRSPLLAGLLMTLTIGSALAHGAHVPKPLPPDPALAARPLLPRIEPAPDLTLTDTRGEERGLSTDRGKVRLVSFIYTSCPDACPILTQRIAALQDALADDHALDRVHLYSVTIDPDRDDREAMARYAKGYEADTASWSFLTAAEERLDPVLAAWDEWRRPVANGDIDHPARLYLIDREGTIREIYSLSFFDERQALLDIRSLLAESS